MLIIYTLYVIHACELLHVYLHMCALTFLRSVREEHKPTNNSPTVHECVILCAVLPSKSVPTINKLYTPSVSPVLTNVLFGQGTLNGTVGVTRVHWDVVSSSNDQLMVTFTFEYVGLLVNLSVGGVMSAR